MDQQAANLLAVLRDSNVPVDTKLDLIDKLKSHIKHHVVPESAVAPTFDVIRLGLTFSQLQDAAFSVLSHMTKRMMLQHQQDLLGYQGSKTYSTVLERLGDVRDRIQARAVQCLSDFWKVSPQEIETMVRDQALSSPKPRTRKAAVQWVGRTHRDHNLPFKSFVPKLIQCAEESDASVSDVARSSLVELFRNASEPAKADLQRQLARSNVPSETADSMLAQIGYKISSSTPHGSPASSRVLSEKAAPPTTKSSSNTAQTPSSSRDVGAAKGKKGGPVPPGIDSADAIAPPVAASTKAELDPAKPIDVSHGQFHLSRHLTMDNKDHSVKLEDLWRDFQPDFEGKETEQNWLARDKHILTLRKLNKGNAPSDFHTVYLAQVKLFRDAILKVVNSLRTTPSTNACYLVQELARTLGSGIDPMVEWLMENLIKLAGHTKAISAQNANQTISTLFNHVSYTKNLLLHISNASNDKNVRPRGFAQGWLKAVIGRHVNHKHVLEHGNGVDTLEKILRKGLTDPDPGVRESARDAYWSFNPLWPARGEVIMASLSNSHQNQLLQHASNPDKSQAATQVSGGSRAAFSKSTTATTRPSLKETMLAKKREKERLERPASAQAMTSPVRNAPSRPQTSLATGSLSSAPLRPVRPKSAMRKAESPKMGVKSAAKKPASQSPTKGSPTKAAEDLTMIVPNVSLGPPIELVSRPKTADSASSGSAIGGAKSVDTRSEQGEVTPTSNRPQSTHGKEAGSRPSSRPGTAPQSSLNVGAMSMSTPDAAKPDWSEPAGPESSPTPARSPAAKSLHSPSRTKAVPAVEDEAVQEESRPASVQIHDEGSPRPASAHSQKSAPGPMKEDANEAPVVESDTNGNRPLTELSESQTNNTTNEPGDAKTARLIDSGIKRITAKTLDAHGFRKLQSTITSNPSVLSPEKLEELLRAVIPRIGDDTSPADDRILTQQLLLLKTLARGTSYGADTKGAATPTSYVPEALANVLTAMGRYEEQSRTQVTLEATFDELSAVPDFPTVPSAHAVQGLATRLLPQDDARAQRTLGHALDALGKLLQKTENDEQLPHDVLPTATAAIRHQDASVRKKAYGLAAATFRAMSDPAPFWVAVESLPKADQAMLHYVVEK